MLRISVVGSSGGVIALRVEGQVKGRWVEELRTACDGALISGARLTLDVADVSFIDACGVALLRCLVSRQVAILNPSPFVAEQLKDSRAGCGGNC